MENIKRMMQIERTKSDKRKGKKDEKKKGKNKKQ